MTRMRKLVLFGLALALVVLAAIGFLVWSEGKRVARLDQVAERTGGNPQDGPRLALAYGCGTCHVIPGVRGATGRVGPPLAGMAARSTVGGSLALSPESLVAWIVDPPAVDPRTAMPKTGITQGEARSVAAYLLSSDSD